MEATVFSVEEMAEDLRIGFNKLILTQVAEKPASRILNLEEVSLEDIEGYFRSLHSTTWGKGFSVLSGGGMEKAAKYFKEELNQFYEFFSGIYS